MPNSYVAGYHRYLSVPFMAACYWSYYMASASDPGRLNKNSSDAIKERALKRYGFDNILFSDKNWCKTCEIVKPARSKHCSLCNVCCEKMDHHCVWINNCVGLHNYKYFILFLYLHTGICIYGVSIGLLTAQHLIDEQDLWNKTFYTRNGQHFKADIWIVMQYLQNEHEMFAIVVFLCGIVTVMLIGFIGFHTFLIYNDYTTNEFAKRQQVTKFIKDRVAFLLKWEKARDEGKAFKPAQKAIDKYNVGKDI